MSDARDTERRECRVEPIEIEVDSGALATAEERFLAVGGMGCTTCATRVHNALVRLPGVLTADVELESGLAQVWLSEPVDAEMLVDAIDEAGQLAGHSYLAGPISLDVAWAKRASMAPGPQREQRR